MSDAPNRERSCLTLFCLFFMSNVSSEEVFDSEGTFCRSSDHQSATMGKVCRVGFSIADPTHGEELC